MGGNSPLDQKEELANRLLVMLMVRDDSDSDVDGIWSRCYFLLCQVTVTKVRITTRRTRSWEFACHRFPNLYFWEFAGPQNFKNENKGDVSVQ